MNCARCGHLRALTLLPIPIQCFFEKQSQHPFGTFTGNEEKIILRFELFLYPGLSFSNFANELAMGVVSTFSSASSAASSFSFWGISFFSDPGNSDID
jgi:hypothetical protein